MWAMDEESALIVLLALVDIFIILQFILHGRNRRVSGVPGRPGSSGLQGPMGSPGASGPVGPSGPVGATGSTGTSGPAGAAGTTGTSGPAGAAGTTGASGPGVTPAYAQIYSTNTPGLVTPGSPVVMTATGPSANVTVTGNETFTIVLPGDYRIAYFIKPATVSGGGGAAVPILAVSLNGTPLANTKFFAFAIPSTLPGPDQLYFAGTEAIVTLATGDTLQLINDGTSQWETPIFTIPGEVNTELTIQKLSSP
jgi:hypothetical protein